jgi:NTE family protein
MRDSLEKWARQLPPDAKKGPVQVYVPELTFESITNDQERNFFNDVPTSFSLPDQTVDRLIEAGRRLLRESPDFQRLTANLQGPHAAGPR